VVKSENFDNELDVFTFCDMTLQQALKVESVLEF